MSIPTSQATPTSKTTQTVKTATAQAHTYLHSDTPRRGGYYLLTLLIELISATLRFLIVSALAFFLLTPVAMIGILIGINDYQDYVSFAGVFNASLADFIGDPIRAWIGVSVVIGLVLGFGMIVLSLFSLAEFQGGYTFTRFLLGARDMSQREQELYLSLLQEINEIAPKGTKGFTHAYVVDNPLSRTFLIGTTLYVSSGALEDRHALAIIAHEFGQLQRKVGGTIHALRLLVFPLFYVFLRNVRTWSTATKAGVKLPEEVSQTDLFFTVANAMLFFFLSLFGGGLGVWVTSPLWAKYFREEDYIADEFVVACGLRDELIEYLEQNRLFDTAVPYMMGWQPANESRLDRLVAEPPHSPSARPKPAALAYTRPQAQVTPSSQTTTKPEQVKQSGTPPPGTMGAVAATAKGQQITPQTIEKALIAVFEPKHAPPSSEALIDQDVFVLLGVEDGADEQKQEFLDELVQVVWDDFVEEEAPELLKEADRHKLQELYTGSKTKELSNQGVTVDFLNARIPDLDRHIVALAAELKRSLMEERVAGMRELYKADPKALATIAQAETLIMQDKWRSAAMLLNGLEDSGVSGLASVVLTDEKITTSEAPDVVYYPVPPELPLVEAKWYRGLKSGLASLRHNQSFSDLATTIASQLEERDSPLREGIPDPAAEQDVTQALNQLQQLLEQADQPAEYSALLTSCTHLLLTIGHYLPTLAQSDYVRSLLPEQQAFYTRYMTSRTGVAAIPTTDPRYTRARELMEQLHTVFLTRILPRIPNLSTLLTQVAERIEEEDAT